MGARHLAGTDDSVATLFGSSPPDGCVVFTMDASGFRANNYLSGWSAPGTLVRPGDGWFFKNPFSTKLTNTIVGTVVQGHVLLPSGFSACSSIVPIGGGISSTLLFPTNGGGTLYTWNNSNNTYSNYTFLNAWSPSEPSIAVGQSFWVRRNASADWAQTNFGFGNISMSVPALAAPAGQLNFFTFNATNAGFGRVFDSDGVTPLAAGALGQLYAGKKPFDSLVPLGAPVSFQSGAGSGYISSDVVTVPFATGGQTVYVQLRCWKQASGASYEAAVTNGGVTARSSVLRLTAHAVIENGNPGVPPPEVNLFPSFRLSPLPPPLSIVRSGTNAIVSWVAPSTGFFLQQLPAFNTNNWTWTDVTNAVSLVNGRNQVTVSATTSDHFFRLNR
jgi:hypothetical protein